MAPGMGLSAGSLRGKWLELLLLYGLGASSEGSVGH